MALEQSESSEQVQRIQVEMEPAPCGKIVRIRVEHFEERLGWYVSGSIRLPLHQLPLLEQAVEEMRNGEAARTTSPEDTIIPLPVAWKE